MKEEVFRKARVVFTIEGCPECRIYKSILQDFNSRLPVDKRVLMVDCTRYHDFGIIDNNLI